MGATTGATYRRKEEGVILPRPAQSVRCQYHVLSGHGCPKLELMDIRDSGAEPKVGPEVGIRLFGLHDGMNPALGLRMYAISTRGWCYDGHRA